MAEKIAWQSRKYTFPKTLYLVMARVSFSDVEGGMYAVLIPAVKNEREVRELWISYQEMIKENRPNVVLGRKPLVWELTLANTVPLNKAMWARKGRKYSGLQRSLDFNNSAKYPNLYKYVVVPARHTKTTEHFEVMMPIPATLTKQDLVKTFGLIDYPVDAEAVEAAIYRFNNIGSVY